MTEAEWLTTARPTPLFLFVREKLGDRRLRLFSCAVHRRMSRFSDRQTVVFATSTSERYADGEASATELAEARQSVTRLWDKCHKLSATMPGSPLGLVIGGARQVTRSDAQKVLLEIEQIADQGGVEPHVRADLFRDIFGNPFRPVALNPAWLTSTVVSIAHAIYSDRAFDRMPILADALQDAGCEDANILAHCRGDGPHVRGCWVVDLVLGKS